MTCLISSRRKTSLLLYKLWTIRSMRRLTCHQGENNDKHKLIYALKENKIQSMLTMRLKQSHCWNGIPLLDTQISQRVDLMHQMLLQLTRTGCQVADHFSGLIVLNFYPHQISHLLIPSTIWVWHHSAQPTNCQNICNTPCWQKRTVPHRTGTKFTTYGNTHQRLLIQQSMLSWEDNTTWWYSMSTKVEPSYQGLKQNSQSNKMIHHHHLLPKTHWIQAIKSQAREKITKIISRYLIKCPNELAGAPLCKQHLNDAEETTHRENSNNQEIETSSYFFQQKKRTFTKHKRFFFFLWLKLKPTQIDKYCPGTRVFEDIPNR